MHTIWCKICNWYNCKQFIIVDRDVYVNRPEGQLTWMWAVWLVCVVCSIFRGNSTSEQCSTSPISKTVTFCFNKLSYKTPIKQITRVIKSSRDHVLKIQDLRSVGLSNVACLTPTELVTTLSRRASTASITVSAPAPVPPLSGW